MNAVSNAENSRPNETSHIGSTGQSLGSAYLRRRRVIQTTGEEVIQHIIFEPAPIISSLAVFDG